MQLPAAFYGSAREVKKRCRTIVTAFVRGARLSDAVGSDQLATQTTSGLIVLDGPSSLLGGQSHFHVYMLLSLLSDAFLDRPELAGRQDEAFADALATGWGTLSLVAYANVHWLNRHADRFRPFIDAVSRHWADFQAEGARYTNGTPDPATLWYLPTSLHFVLANMGVPNEALNSPTAPEDPSALLKLAPN